MTLEQGPQRLRVLRLRHHLLPVLERLLDRRARADLLVARVVADLEGAAVGREMEVPARGDRLVRVNLSAVVELHREHPHEPGDELFADQPEEGLPGGLDPSRDLCAVHAGSIARTCATRQDRIATKVQQLRANCASTEPNSSIVVQHAAYGATVHLHAYHHRPSRRAPAPGEN